MEYYAVLNQIEVRELTLHLYFTDICHFASLLITPITEKNSFAVTLRQQVTGFNELADSFSTGMLNYWNWHKKFILIENDNMYSLDNFRKFVTDRNLQATDKGTNIIKRAETAAVGGVVHLNSIEHIMDSVDLTIGFLEDVMNNPSHFAFTESANATFAG